MAKKIFPFAPGVTWDVNGYVKPKLDYKSFNKLIENKNIVLLCFGGIFESYFSLSILEAYRHIGLNNRLYYKTYSKYNIIYKMNELSSEFKYSIGDKFHTRYTTPLFNDNSGNAYANVLNDYLFYKNFRYKGKFRRKSSVLSQMFDNSLLDWDSYYPVIRNDGRFDNWCRINKFDYKTPFVCIFPEKTGNSIHKSDFLGWSVGMTREFSSMVKTHANVIICTNHPERYHGTGAFIVKPDNIDIIIGLIVRCSFVLSNEADYLLIGLLNDKYIIFNQLKGYMYKCLRPELAAEYLNVPLNYFKSSMVTPHDAFSIVKIGVGDI